LVITACARGPDAIEPTARVGLAPKPEPVATASAETKPDPGAIAPWPDCEEFSDLWFNASLQQARVRIDADRRLHFQRGGEGCPGQADCERAAYLVPSDRAYAATHGDWACLWFLDAKLRSTVGWVPKAALELEALPVPATGDWIGEWRNSVDDIEPSQGSEWHNTVAIREDGERLAMEGEGIWLGPVLDAAGNRSVHDAYASGQLKPEAGRAVIAATSEYDCGLELRRFSDVLLVRDNLQCGGVNASVSGIYRRNPVDSEDAR
jgi:hypothetical protein